MDRNPLSGSDDSASPLAHLVFRTLGHHRARLASPVSRGILMARTALSLITLLLATTLIAAPPYWTVVWCDEFDGPAGAPPDATKWTYDTGAGGWGNQELETYTSSRDNSYLDGNGNLVIEVRELAP